MPISPSIANKDVRDFQNKNATQCLVHLSYGFAEHGKEESAIDGK